MVNTVTMVTKCQLPILVDGRSIGIHIVAMAMKGQGHLPIIVDGRSKGCNVMRVGIHSIHLQKKMMTLFILPAFISACAIRKTAFVNNAEADQCLCYSLPM